MNIQIIVKPIKTANTQALASLVFCSTVLQYYHQSMGAGKKTVNEKALRRRKHCALAVVRWSQFFRPTADHLPGGAGWPKFNQLEMVTTFTYKPSLVKTDARNFELSW